MQIDLGFVAFVVLIVAQFLAVVFVNHDTQGNRTAPASRTSEDVRTWNIWLSA